MEAEDDASARQITIEDWNEIFHGPDMEPMLCPTSRLSIRPVSHPSELEFHLGQEIRVKYKGRDPESGLID